MYTIKSRLLWLVTISILSFFSCSKNSDGFKKDLQVFKERGWSGLTDYDFKIDERGTYQTGNDSNIFLRAVEKEKCLLDPRTIFIPLRSATLAIISPSREGLTKAAKGKG